MVLMLRFWSRLETYYQIRWNQVDLDEKEKECNVRRGFEGRTIKLREPHVEHLPHHESPKEEENRFEKWGKGGDGTGEGMGEGTDEGEASVDPPQADPQVDPGTKQDQDGNGVKISLHTLADLLPREKNLVVLEDFPLPSSSYFKRYLSINQCRIVNIDRI